MLNIGPDANGNVPVASKEILLKAGFNKKEGAFEYSTEVDNRKRTIIVALSGSDMYGRDFVLLVCNGNRNPICYACVQALDHFNKLMNIMDINFRLKE